MTNKDSGVRRNIVVDVQNVREKDRIGSALSGKHVIFSVRTE